MEPSPPLPLSLHPSARAWRTRGWNGTRLHRVPLLVASPASVGRGTHSCAGSRDGRAPLALVNLRLSITAPSGEAFFCFGSGLLLISWHVRVWEDFPAFLKNCFYCPSQITKPRLALLPGREQRLEARSEQETRRERAFAVLSKRYGLPRLKHLSYASPACLFTRAANWAKSHGDFVRLTNVG